MLLYQDASRPSSVPSPTRQFGSTRRADCRVRDVQFGATIFVLFARFGTAGPSGASSSIGVYALAPLRSSARAVPSCARFMSVTVQGALSAHPCVVLPADSTRSFRRSFSAFRSSRAICPGFGRAHLTIIVMLPQDKRPPGDSRPVIAGAWCEQGRRGEASGGVSLTASRPQRGQPSARPSPMLAL